MRGTENEMKRVVKWHTNAERPTDTLKHVDGQTDGQTEKEIQTNT